MLMQNFEVTNKEHYGMLMFSGVVNGMDAGDKFQVNTLKSTKMIVTLP